MNGPAKRSALVVEDDPRQRLAIGEQLARMNFEVLYANHDDGAIRLLEMRTADIVCIDIGLPNRSGYELCESIRGAMGLTRVPIIAMSEHGNSHDMACAEEAGANAFLRKPFTMRQLAHSVQSLLDRKPGRALPAHELALRYEYVEAVALAVSALATSPAGRARA